jgi:hypothetical protein
MTEVRRPVHLAVLVGASASLYAVSLAGISVLQSATDSATIQDHAPLDSATNGVAAGHDALETDLARATWAFSDAAARYDRLAPRLAETETSLDALSAVVAKLSGAAGALPGRAPLPPVARVVSTSKAPATHATTGASGK